MSPEPAQTLDMNVPLVYPISDRGRELFGLVESLDGKLRQVFETFPRDALDLGHGDDYSDGGVMSSHSLAQDLVRWSSGKRLEIRVERVFSYFGGSKYDVVARAVETTKDNTYVYTLLDRRVRINYDHFATDDNVEAA